MIQIKKIFKKILQKRKEITFRKTKVKYQIPWKEKTNSSIDNFSNRFTKSYSEALSNKQY